LLSLSGLTSAQANSLITGTVLTIPQSGAFPGNRALAHPATYTVASADETVYSIACKYGDVDPNAIATANGISASAKLDGWAGCKSRNAKAKAQVECLGFFLQRNLPCHLNSSVLKV
jgi:hypothetical protein